MRRVADAILGSLLCGSDDVSGSVQPHPVVAFLQSPPYQDMRGLHEALIASVLSHSAAKAPKWYSVCVCVRGRHLIGTVCV